MPANDDYLLESDYTQRPSLHHSLKVSSVGCTIKMPWPLKS